jgi:excisionase family DNA binding protein
MTTSGHVRRAVPVLPFEPIVFPKEPTDMADQLQADALLTPAEVAALFRVNPKTVTRWARAGKITAIRTLGGHRRFRASEIRRCLEQMEHTEL